MVALFRCQPLTTESQSTRRKKKRKKEKKKGQVRRKAGLFYFHFFLVCLLCHSLASSEKRTRSLIHSIKGSVKSIAKERTLCHLIIKFKKEDRTSNHLRERERESSRDETPKVCENTALPNRFQRKMPSRVLNTPVPRAVPTPCGSW